MTRGGIIERHRRLVRLWRACVPWRSYFPLPGAESSPARGVGGTPDRRHIPFRRFNITFVSCLDCFVTVPAPSSSAPKARLCAPQPCSRPNLPQRACRCMLTRSSMRPSRALRPRAASKHIRCTQNHASCHWQLGSARSWESKDKDRKLPPARRYGMASAYTMGVFSQKPAKPSTEHAYLCPRLYS